MEEERHLLAWDVELLQTQYINRNRAGNEWTPDERRRWPAESVAVLRAIETHLTADEQGLARSIDRLCSYYEHRHEHRPDLRLRQAWGKRAFEIICDARKLLWADFEPQLGKYAFRTSCSAWNSAMIAGVRAVTYKAGRKAPLRTQARPAR